MKASIPSKYVIQADKLGSIIDMLESIADGPMSDSKIGNMLGITKRQGTYYRTAAESIGLIRYENEKAELTELGEILVNKMLERPEQISFLRVVIMTNPLLRRVVNDLEMAGEDGLGIDEIERLVSESSDLSADTVGRRVESIIKWLTFLKLAKMKGNIVMVDTPLFEPVSED